MTTQHKENYGRDVRNFHHPEEDLKAASDITNADESYIDQYLSDHDDDEEIVNQDDDIINNEDETLNNEFSEALEREEFYEEEDEIDPNDIDDDLVEDYDENDKDVDDFATDNHRKDPLDLEYDIDQDLEETDPVNHPRSFKY